MGLIYPSNIFVFVFYIYDHHEVKAVSKYLGAYNPQHFI